MAYEDFVKRMTADGLTSKEHFANSAKEYINDKFADSPFFRQVLIAGNPVDVRMSQDTNEYNKRTLFFRPSTKVDIGSYVEIDVEKWIVLDFFNNEIYPKSTINECISSIKWLDEKGIVKEAYFTNNDHLSNNGIVQGQIIDLVNERRHILIQSNPDTRKITKTKRFILDERAWSVNSVDRLKTGLVYLVLKEAEIDPARDNTELGIADFYGNVATYSISITNGEAVSLRPNETLQLSAQVMNNGAVVTPETVVWSVSDASIATVDQNGVLSAIAQGTVTVTAKLANDSAVADSMTASVESVVADAYSIQITSSSTTPNELKSGQSKTYSIRVFNNGTSVSEPVTWSLWADDQVSGTTLATITSQTGADCTVKNNNASSGFIQCKAILNRDPSVFTWLRIQMRSLF